MLDLHHLLLSVLHHHLAPHLGVGEASASASVVNSSSLDSEASSLPQDQQQQTLFQGRTIQQITQSLSLVEL
jgi:hypothetical protein